jgi:hypothetical protein
MPVLRMQPCIQNQGYAAGYAAVLATREAVRVRDIDCRALQRHLVAIGNLPEAALGWVEVADLPPRAVLEAAVATVVDDMQGVESLLADRETSLALLRQALAASDNPSHRLTYARILAALGVDDGWEILAATLAACEGWDAGWNFKGMGHFGRSASPLDAIVIAAGCTRRAEALEALERMARMLGPDAAFSHCQALAMAFEAIGDVKAAPCLEALLAMPGVSGHSIADLHRAKCIQVASPVDTSIRNASLRELVLARALYRCGDPHGVGARILSAYAGDLRGHYSRHALAVRAETPVRRPQSEGRG